MSWHGGHAALCPAYVIRALSSPPVLPDFLTNHAGHTGLLLGHRDDPARGRPTCDFEQQLGPDRLLELVAVLDRYHEGAWAPDDTVLVIEIEIVDIHRRIGRFLHHDRQAVDDDALLQRRVTRGRDWRAVVVGAVAGDIDDTPRDDDLLVARRRPLEIGHRNLAIRTGLQRL